MQIRGSYNKGLRHPLTFKFARASVSCSLCSNSHSLPFNFSPNFTPATMASVKGYTRRENVKDMLGDGRLVAGQKVLFVPTHGRRIYGDLLPDGRITEHDSDCHEKFYYSSLSSFALTIIRRYNYNRKSSNGYVNVWYVAPGDCVAVPLDTLRVPVEPTFGGNELCGKVFVNTMSSLGQKVCLYLRVV